MDPNFDSKFNNQTTHLTTSLDYFPDLLSSSIDWYRKNNPSSSSSSSYSSLISNQYHEIKNNFELNQTSPDLQFLRDPLFPSEPGPDTNSNSNTTIAPPPLPSMWPAGESYSASDELLSAPSGLSPGRDSSSDENDFKETVLKYITQMLMEENIEEKPCMFYDPLGLKLTEKSFYDALGENYISSPDQPPLDRGSSDNVFHGSFSDEIDSKNWADLQLNLGPGEYEPSTKLPRPFPDDLFQSKLHFGSSNQNSLIDDSPELVSELLLAQNMFRDSTTMLQYKKGLEDARKFLPVPVGNQLNLDHLGNFTETIYTNTTENDKREKSSNESKGRKNHKREDVDLDWEEGRRNKHAAVYVDEEELSDVFDKVLLHDCGNEAMKLGESQLNGSNVKAREKKHGKRNDSADLSSLLIQCAQAMSTGDRRTAYELLKQIRQHATPFGDGSQRTAHFFANALEARLAGTGTGTKIYYAALAESKVSAVEILKAYQAHLSSCPFKKLSLFFMIKMILKVAEKARSLHIVDFGISYGFLWPMLIQFLSQLPDGPPKLRITGIEFPQPGFRPEERIDETGRRLAKYCDRFKVPFQFQAIASQNWEKIRIEDLKLDSSEVLAVNCTYRFKNLLDETIEENNSRDTVLHLIRKMNPNIFVHSVINGSYNAPFFLTRFREALFHFSALYDVLDNTASRDSEERMMLEREFIGRQVMNVVACEGVERVERPETYKQWQARCMRAGFRQLPLDPEIMKKFRLKLSSYYHKDFLLDEDGGWMLQGWKGRIVYASCCWVPA